jgi:hypothetical protein
MDLDNWIERVKEGQHLLEDELKRLCEYVSSVLPFTLTFAMSCKLIFLSFGGGRDFCLVHI